jgi:hypothetical protein
MNSEKSTTSASEFLGARRSRLTANTAVVRGGTGVLPSPCSPPTSARLSLSPSFPLPSRGYHFFTPTSPRPRVVPAATCDARIFLLLISRPARSPAVRGCRPRWSPSLRARLTRSPSPVRTPTLSSPPRSTSPAAFPGSDERSRGLLTAGDGEVFSWGRGTFGRLGTGREDDEVVPTAVAPFVTGRPRPRFVAVAAGAYHSLALDGSCSVASLSVSCSVLHPSNFYMSVSRIRRSEKRLLRRKRERDVEMCWIERNVYREVSITVNLIKKYESRTPDKNERGSSCVALRIVNGYCVLQIRQM